MPSSKFADEGTLAHDVADNMLSSFYGKPFTVIEGIDKEMLAYVEVYVDYCINLAVDAEHRAIEQSFQLKGVDERAFGTNDFSCWTDMDVLHIVDLKYGMGVEVQAEGNKQLMYYALGCVLENDLDVNTITLHIVQPRIDDPIKTWTISYTDLMDFKDELVEAIARVDNEPDTFVPGNHCRFCNQAACDKYQDYIKAETGLSVGATMELATPEDLQIEKLMKIKDCTPMIKKWLETVDAIVHDKVSNGQIDLSKFGKKAVKKMKNRAWRDGIPFEKLGLTEEQVTVTTVKPLSPAKVEKLIDKEKKEILDQAVIRKEDGYRIVSESAKGEVVELIVPETLEIL
jgi:hypothetical protein